MQSVDLEFLTGTTCCLETLTYALPLFNSNTRLILQFSLGKTKA
jgi:hypothetical protein